MSCNCWIVKRKDRHFLQNFKFDFSMIYCLQIPFKIFDKISFDELADELPWDDLWEFVQKLFAWYATLLAIEKLSEQRFEQICAQNLERNKYLSMCLKKVKS